MASWSLRASRGHCRPPPPEALGSSLYSQDTWTLRERRSRGRSSRTRRRPCGGASPVPAPRCPPHTHSPVPTGRRAGARRACCCRRGAPVRPPHGRHAVSPCRGAGSAPSGPHGAVPSGSSRLLAGASPQCPRTLGAACRGLALGILDCGVQAALHLGRVHPALAGVGMGPSEADRDSLMEAGGRLKSRALGVGAGSVWLCGHGGHRTVSRSVTGKSLSPHRTTGLTWWP